MGRIVYSDDNLLSNIIKLAKNDGYTPGLILGQNSGQKDYVTHLACTPVSKIKENKDVENIKIIHTVKKISDIEEIWLADHALQVTRMLPGGMWVLGLFIIGPGDIFSDQSCHSKLNSILFSINKHLSSNPHLYGNGPSSEKLIFHLSSSSQKYICKSFDISIAGSAYRPVDWRFQGHNKWHQIECQYDFEQFAIYHVTEKRANLSLKKQLKEILNRVNDNVKNAICVIDGEIKEESAILENTSKGKKEKSELYPLNVNLYVPNELEVFSEDDLKVVDLIGEMKCTGVLSSIVFLHQKAMVKEVIQAVKEDIIRSWAARLEMHWDSLVEEEVGTPEEVMVVHEPPRRILIPLPHSKVAFTDYLFPGESSSEALIFLQELLGIRGNESIVLKDLEGQPDIENLTSTEPSKSENTIDSSSSTNSSILISGILVALVTLILSFIIKLYGNSHS
uniref:Protein odr-4 homolog n=1 Tax=Clastoptera arizonana TaxID=38151 RepID=A0A1B6CVJ3_9HEMI